MTLTKHTLAWHTLLCPHCYRDDHLDVTARIDVRLTEDGSSDDSAVGSAHEWDETSPCVCRYCNFASEVAAFDCWGRIGDEIAITEDEASGDAPCEFEIAVYAMAKVDDGSWQLASSQPGLKATSFDVHLRRTRESTGEIEAIYEFDDVSKEALSETVANLMRRFPSVPVTTS